MAFSCGALTCRLKHENIMIMSLDGTQSVTQSFNELSIWARKRLDILQALESKYSLGNGTADTSQNNSFASMMHHVQKKAVDEDIKSRYTEGAVDGDVTAKQRQCIEWNISRLRNDIEFAYRMAIDRFPKNGTALLEAASFFQHEHENHYLELTLLSLAKRSCQALDIRFEVYQRLRNLREGEHTEKGHHRVTAIDRVLFDQEWKVACNEETKLYRIIYQFWQSLLNPTPDLALLESYAKVFYESLQRAEEKYQSCLRINPESPLALRSYSSFLSTTKGYEEEAEEYRSKAERLEGMLAQSRSRDIHRFLFDQRVAGKGSANFVHRIRLEV